MHIDEVNIIVEENENEKIKYNLNKSERVNDYLMRKKMRQRYENNQYNKTLNDKWNFKDIVNKLKTELPKNYPSISKKDVSLDGNNAELKAKRIKDLSEVKSLLTTNLKGDNVSLKDKIAGDSLEKTLKFDVDSRLQNVQEKIEKTGRDLMLHPESAKKVNVIKNILNPNYNFYADVPNGTFLPKNAKASLPKGTDGIMRYNNRIYFIENKTGNPENSYQELLRFKNNCWGSNITPIITYDANPFDKEEQRIAQNNEWKKKWGGNQKIVENGRVCYVVNRVDFSKGLRNYKVNNIVSIPNIKEKSAFRDLVLNAIKFAINGSNKKCIVVTKKFKPIETLEELKSLLNSSISKSNNEKPSVATPSLKDRFIKASK